MRERAKYVAGGPAPGEPRESEVTVEKADDPSINGTGSVWVRTEALHHFAVTATPDVVYHSKTSTLTVQAKDENGEDTWISGATPLSFSLDANGEKYGHLEGAEGATYSGAQSGKVTYVADGENPMGCPAQAVQITVSSEAGKSGTGSLAVHCSLVPGRYAQNDSTWGKKKYDDTEKSIGSKGCALSSLAMAMTAYGDTVNPKELNDWMNGRKDPNKGGYLRDKVRWNAAYYHSDKKITADREGGNLYYKDSNGKWIQRNPGEKNTDPSVLDDPLSRCELVIVQVSSGANQHWVVVTGKEGDRYAIVDPGADKKHLDDYGDFWGYTVVKKKDCNCP